MRCVLLVCLLSALPLGSRAQDADALLRAAFDNYNTYGISVFAKTLYPEEPSSLKAAEDGLNALSKTLGAVHGGDIVSAADFGKRYRRFYCVLYFDRRPVWFHVDFYTVNGRSFFLPLNASGKPEDILPASLTGSFR